MKSEFKVLNRMKESRKDLINREYFASTNYLEVTHVTARDQLIS